MAQVNRWWRFGMPVVAGVSLASAALADFLFYDQFVGWTLGGFLAWLLLLLLLRSGRVLLTGQRRTWGWALTFMIVGLCVSLALEPGVIAVILAVLLLSTLAMLAHGWSDRALGWRWLVQLGTSWGMAIVRPVLDSKLARRWARRTQGLRSRVIGMARWAWAIAGVVIPLVLSLIFLGLFALANPVVADWMSRGSEQVGDFFSNLTDYITFSRVLWWLLGALACWGLLRHRPRRRLKFRRIRSTLASIMPNTEQEPVIHWQEPEVNEQVEPSVSSKDDDPSSDKDWLSWLAGKYTNLVVRCLIAMNIVFALQLVLDSRYLVFGGKLPEGMTYAEYAHRGAYPLIVTAIFAATLVLAVFRPGGIAQRSKFAVWLVILWIAQNIVLVASAAWRLQAYVEVYTLTRLRVAAGVWMLMVAGCLALLLWRIARSHDNHWLTGWAMGWGIAVLWVCSFVPFDPMIAHYNVRNCKELGGQGQVIDIVYLEQLGPDALPAIAYLIENLPEEAAAAPPRKVPDQSWERGGGSRVERIDYDEYGNPVVIELASLGEQLAEMRLRLSGDLDEQLEGWRGWTVRRAWLEQSAEAD